MNQSKKGFIYTTIGATLWGINGAFAEFLFLQKGVTSDWLTPYRLLLAGVFLLVYLYAKDKNKIFDIFRNTKDLIRVFVFGVFGMLGTQYTYFTTIQHSNAGIATVLQYFGPTLILLYVCFKEKRKPKPYEVVVLFLSLLGVFILATHGDMNTLKVSSVALFWGMLSAITLVIYIGGIALSITAKPWEQPVKVDIVVIVFLLLIVLLGSIFAFLFYLSGVGIIGPTKASMIACIEPVVATICSVVFLGNPFSFLDAIGFAFILSTVFIVAYISDRENKKNTTQ